LHNLIRCNKGEQNMATEGRGVSMTPEAWERVEKWAKNDGRKSLSEAIERLLMLCLDRIEKEQKAA
jgi:hypothetical protein